jgi:hypothetical protein
MKLLKRILPVVRRGHHPCDVRTQCVQTRGVDDGRKGPTAVGGQSDMEELDHFTNSRGIRHLTIIEPSQRDHDASGT